jgi:hypothetical protein
MSFREQIVAAVCSVKLPGHKRRSSGWLRAAVFFQTGKLSAANQFERGSRRSRRRQTEASQNC